MPDRIQFNEGPLRDEPTNTDTETGTGTPTSPRPTNDGGGGTDGNYSLGNAIITFRADKSNYTATVGNLQIPISNTTGTNSINIRSLNNTLANVQKDRHTADVTYRLTYIPPRSGGDFDTFRDDNINRDIQRT